MGRYDIIFVKAGTRVENHITGYYREGRSDKLANRNALLDAKRRMEQGFPIGRKSDGTSACTPFTVVYDCDMLVWVDDPEYNELGGD